MTEEKVAKEWGKRINDLNEEPFWNKWDNSSLKFREGP